MSRLYLVLCAALASWLPAQAPAHVVVPSEFAASEAPRHTLWTGLSVDARRQLLIDARHLPAVSGQRLVALTVRRDGQETGLSRSGRVWLEIGVSNTSVAPMAAASSFAANRGTDHVQVFMGYVSFPALGAPAAAPAPWAAPYSVTIDFAKPFAYSGGHVCLEVVTRRSAPNDSTPPVSPWFLLDAVVLDSTGAVTSYGTSCIPETPPSPARATEPSLSLGSTAKFTLSAARADALALFAFGSARWDLPLDAVGARGCTLYPLPLDLLVSRLQAVPNTPLGVAVLRLPLPAVPSLAGVRLQAQWILVDPSANALGMTLSNGLDVVLGRQPDLGLASVEMFDPAATLGEVSHDRSPVLRLRFEKG